MFDTDRTTTIERTSLGHPTTPTGDDISARLRWLIAFDEYDKQRRRLFRSAREEEEMLSMRRPFEAAQAYGRFGLLLGLLPPIAIFYRLFFFPHLSEPSAMLADKRVIVAFLLSAFMTFICALVGRAMGSQVGRSARGFQERRRAGRARVGRYIPALVVYALLGLGWGLVTGAAGGLIVFGIGALFGAACAAPVGALGFTLFAPLHRLLSRGGMIDARHFWPLASGITLLIVALILSPHVFPYRSF